MWLDRPERGRQDHSAEDRRAHLATIIGLRSGRRERRSTDRGRFGRPSRADRAREHQVVWTDIRALAYTGGRAFRRDSCLLRARGFARYPGQVLLEWDAASP